MKTIFNTADGRLVIEHPSVREDVGGVLLSVPLPPIYSLDGVVIAMDRARELLASVVGDGQANRFL